MLTEVKNGIDLSRGTLAVTVGTIPELNHRFCLLLLICTKMELCGLKMVLIFYLRILTLITVDLKSKI